MRIAILVLAVVAACGGGKKPDPVGGGSGTSGGGTTFDPAIYRCTPPDGVDGSEAAAECTARPEGCKYTQQLTCRGTQPPPDIEEAERQARESGTIGCACVCPADEVACRMVP